MQKIVEQSLSALGYELVEVQRGAGGLLRVTIDLPWQPPELNFITIEDCEKATRQLQFALEVEGIDYQRLEVSSPGIDRLLRHEQDLVRFSGEMVDITLKEPIGDAAQGDISPKRKKFRGTLERLEDGTGWQIVWSQEAKTSTKPGQRISKKRSPAPLHALSFTFEELREVRLADVVNFKGRTGR